MNCFLIRVDQVEICQLVFNFYLKENTVFVIKLHQSLLRLCHVFMHAALQYKHGLCQIERE